MDEESITPGISFRLSSCSDSTKKAGVLPACKSHK